MWLFSEFLLIPGRKPYVRLNIGRIFFLFIDYNPFFGLETLEGVIHVLYKASKYTVTMYECFVIWCCQLLYDYKREVEHQTSLDLKLRYSNSPDNFNKTQFPRDLHLFSIGMFFPRRFEPQLSFFVLLMPLCCAFVMKKWFF